MLSCGRRIALTDADVALVDDLIATHQAIERQLLAVLTPEQLAALDAVLAKPAASLESGLA